MKGNEIEAESFRIIEEEAGDHGLDERHWPIVRRMIHTSADFEYIHTARFHPDAVEKGIRAIQRGEMIITDTAMAMAGIRKKTAERFGCRVECLISRPDVVQTARENDRTRAEAAVDTAVESVDSGIFVVGNAPTALMRILELVRRGRAAPSLILGFPVGFVNAAESKESLLFVDVPFITNAGRKGGSNIAAAVVNALLITAEERKGT